MTLYSQQLLSRVISILNNNEFRYRYVRRWLIKWANLWERPWFFLHRPPRCYLRKNLSVEQFFLTLKQRDVNYVVLRWFETLPDISEGEDIDILIQDEHLIRLADLVNSRPTGQALDLYTCQGSYGRTFGGRAYFPAWIAHGILSRRVWSNRIYAVPRPQDHLLSMLYHLLFHKREKAFTSDSELKPELLLGHDYRTVITTAAKKSGVSIQQHTAKHYFDVMRTFDYAPPLDYLRFWSHTDPWLGQFVPEKLPISQRGQMVVFIIRQRAIRRNKSEQILAEIGLSFEILSVRRLDSAEARDIAMRVRGGNWSRGPFVIGGGYPAIVVVCFDYHPQEVSVDVAKKFPNVTNEKLFIKHRLRAQLNKGLPFFLHSNDLHSCDDEQEALEFLSRFDLKLAEEMKCACRERRQAYYSSEIPLQLLCSHRTRSKLELIQQNGAKYVKKTYQANSLRFLHREIFAMETIAKNHPNVLPLLEKGTNYFVTIYVENQLNKLDAMAKAALLKQHGQTIVNFIKYFYTKGYALIDFKPDNLLVSGDNKIYVVDFEFLHKYKSKPASLTESYDIAGIPNTPTFDLPGKFSKVGRTWKNTWEFYLGDIRQYLG